MWAAKSWSSSPQLLLGSLHEPSAGTCGMLEFGDSINMPSLCQYWVQYQVKGHYGHSPDCPFLPVWIAQSALCIWFLVNHENAASCESARLQGLSIFKGEEMRGTQCGTEGPWEGCLLGQALVGPTWALQPAGGPCPRVACEVDERRREAERRMQRHEVAANTWGSNKRVGKHDGWQYQFTSSLALARFSVGIVVKEMFEW